MNLGAMGNKRALRIPQSSGNANKLFNVIFKTLVRGVLLSTAMQLMYSTAPADWARVSLEEAVKLYT